MDDTDGMIIAGLIAVVVGAVIGGLINLAICDPSNFWVGAAWGAGCTALALLGGDPSDFLD